MFNFLNYCTLNILATCCLFVLHIPVIRPLWPADSKSVDSMQKVGPWGRILPQWLRAPSNGIGPASNTPIHSGCLAYTWDTFGSPGLPKLGDAGIRKYNMDKYVFPVFYINCIIPSTLGLQPPDPDPRFMCFNF